MVRRDTMSNTNVSEILERSSHPKTRERMKLHIVKDVAAAKKPYIDVKCIQYEYVSLGHNTGTPLSLEFPKLEPIIITGKKGR